MAEDLAQQLQLVQQELNQVQDQISTLLEHQERLLGQREELQGLLDACRDLEGDGVQAGDSGSAREDWSGSFEWDERAADLRLNVFGISSYRPNQREIINAVMSGRDVVVIMAAGGGKSLCYQLPALLRTGIALIISPLLSLIQDQVMGLTALGITAGMLTSTTSKDQEKSIYLSLEKGLGDLRILYVTPEKIAKSKRFMSKLEKCNKSGRLSLMAIDEAHCCSQWGHDFRTDYKNLGILKKQFPKVPIMALTATATQRVQTDVREMLQISYCERFVTSINRPNLFYEVRDKKASASGAVDDIADFIKGEYTEKESGIVYCFTRRECEQVAEELRKRGISAAHYHADMPPNLRSSVHTRWSSNKVQVIVGTVAFGMGINKPDVRFVIHHSLSKSLETYYQESGRAGRDGLPSHCLLFFRSADVPRQSSMVFSEVAGLSNLYAISRFCQSKRACRRGSFFRHFGEQPQDCNGMCDNCAYGKDVSDLDVTAHAKSLVTLLKELDNLEQKTTMLQLVDMWRSRSRQTGEGNAALVKELSKEDVERVILQLILDGILKEEFQHTAYATNAYVAVSAGSRSLMQGQRRILLEVVQGIKSKKISGGSAQEESKLQSGMGLMLDALRQQLASSHGSIFPHSVLSSQHIKVLCNQQSDSLDHIQAVIGKRKAEQYGQDILDAINDYVKQHPQEILEKTGPWISPKLASRSPAPGSKTPKSSKLPITPKTSVKQKTRKIPAVGLTATERKRSPASSTPLKSSENVETTYIDLDSDSEQEEPTGGKESGSETRHRKPAESDMSSVKVETELEKSKESCANNPAQQPKSGIGKRSFPQSSDEDDDFVLIKRVRRK